MTVAWGFHAGFCQKLSAYPSYFVNRWLGIDGDRDGNIFCRTRHNGWWHYCRRHECLPDSDIRPPQTSYFGPRWSARRLWEQACGVPRPAHACFFYRATLDCVRAIPLSSNGTSTKMKAVNAADTTISGVNRLAKTCS